MIDRTRITRLQGLGLCSKETPFKGWQGLVLLPDNNVTHIGLKPVESKFLEEGFHAIHGKPCRIDRGLLKRKVQFEVASQLDKFPVQGHAVLCSNEVLMPLSLDLVDLGVDALDASILQYQFRGGLRTDSLDTRDVVRAVTHQGEDVYHV